MFTEVVCLRCQKPLETFCVTVLENSERSKHFHRPCYEEWRQEGSRTETKDDYARWYWWWQTRRGQRP